MSDRGLTSEQAESSMGNNNISEDNIVGKGLYNKQIPFLTIDGVSLILTQKRIGDADVYAINIGTGELYGYRDVLAETFDRDDLTPEEFMKELSGVRFDDIKELFATFELDEDIEA